MTPETPHPAELLTFSTSRPQLRDWGLAILSLFGVILLCGAVTLIITTFKVQIALSGFRDALERSDFQGAKSYFDAAQVIQLGMLTEPFLMPIAKRLRPRKFDAISALLDTLIFVQSNDLDRAKSRFLLLWESPEGAASLQSAKESAHDLETTMKESSRFLMQNEELIRALVPLTAERQMLSNDYLDLRGELGAFLTIPVDTTLPSDGSLPVYQSGIFAHLPIIEDLNDDIVDLESLKRTLQRAGGAVNVQASSGDAYSPFMARLTELQQRGNALAKQISDLDEKTNLVNKGNLQTKSKLETLKRSISEKTKNLILKLNA